MGFQTIGPVPGAVVECSRDLPHDASALDDAERHPAGGRNRSQCVFESRASTGGVAGGTADSDDNQVTRKTLPRQMLALPARH